MRRHKLLAPGIGAFVLALALIVAACGGGSSYSSTTSATSTTKALATPLPATATHAATAAPATPTPAASAPAASATVDTAVNGTLNKTILVDSRGMTLYTFANDKAGTSACNGTCAANWPPLAPGAGSPTGGSGVTGTLGTITRSDGTKQVTYNGSPLYGWVQDRAPGDVTGDGVNNFHVAVP